VRRTWLLFSQWVTVIVAALFVVQTLRPEWLSWRPGQAETPKAVVVNQAPAGAHLVAPTARADSYHGAVQKAIPAVVNIFTAKALKRPQSPFSNDPLFQRFFGDMFSDEARKTSSLGSGVVVSTKGYVITNNHVVEGADEIDIAFVDGKKLRAKVVGTDPETDLAVLKVESGDLPAITFAPADGTRVGDVVLAIGNPFGVGQTVTMGIVSALGRTELGINTFENFIQTDAAINPGNSGGALVDAAGNLVGINTAIYSRTGGSLGIGFAIPVSTARQVMEQLIEKGRVTRGWIGVEAQEVTPELAASFKLDARDGALIANVVKGGPAERAGIRPGDLLVSIDGKSVANPSGMLNIVASLAPDASVPVKIRREGKEADVPVTIGTRPAARRPTREPR
jgi:serine protease DegQ